jgi:hypothetical protein
MHRTGASTQTCRAAARPARRHIRAGIHGQQLCVGDDWAQDRHDVEVTDEAGTVQGPDDALGEAFIRGVLGAVVMIRSPSALNTSPKAVVKSGSRS